MHTPQRIVVPVINTPASLAAVHLAATLARARKGQVFAVHVIEVNRSLPLNAEMDAEARRGEQVIRKAEEIGGEVGCPVTGVLLQARDAGPAILEEAHDRDADAILLGLRFERETGPGHHGHTAEHLLRNARCEVWVVRESAPGYPGKQEVRRE